MPLQESCQTEFGGERDTVNLGSARPEGVTEISYWRYAANL